MLQRLGAHTKHALVSVLVLTLGHTNWNKVIEADYVFLKELAMDIKTKFAYTKVPGMKLYKSDR